MRGKRLRVHDFHSAQMEAHLRRPRANRLGVAQQHRLGDFLIQQNLAGAQDLGLFALRENHPFGLALGLVDHAAHHFVGAAQTALQLLAILGQIDRLLRHAGFHGRLRHRRGFPDQHARIEGLGDDVFAAEREPLHAVGLQHRIGHVFLGQRGQGARGRQLHLVVDGGGAHVQRPAENERETQHVVHLVGIIRASGGHDGIGPRGQCHVVGDLGVGVGQGEDQRIGRHALHHFGADGAAGGEAEEHVGAFQGLGQRAAVRYAPQSGPCRGSCLRCGLRRSRPWCRTSGCSRGARPG